jgi:hypothetical protein
MRTAGKIIPLKKALALRAGLKRAGKRTTPEYGHASLNFYRAQQRYRNAQKLLRLNPLPGDE